MPRRLDKSVNADNLLLLRERLVKRGMRSDMLDLRLEYVENTQIVNHYLSALYDRAPNGVEFNADRIYPRMLPTQASGRWSITEPPLANFPADIRDTIRPDPGWAWICWDLDQIEARIVAAYSHDRDDLDAFNLGYDIHTITVCKMTGLPLPPNLRDPHTSPECEEWRRRLNWKGKDDKRRILAKVRYCLLYGRDKTAVSGSKYERDMVKLGFKREDLMRAADLFLRSKPNLLACKRKWWDETAKRSEARTIFGRRRRLFGDYWTRAKEGWNHMVQGAVVDMTNNAIIDLCQPPRFLVYQAHDGVKDAVPLHTITNLTWPEFLSSVEKEYTIEGETFVSTATWQIIFDDGSHKPIDKKSGLVGRFNELG